jgi:hypothetical protein
MQRVLSIQRKGHSNPKGNPHSQFTIPFQFIVLLKAFFSSGKTKSISHFEPAENCELSNKTAEDERRQNPQSRKGIVPNKRMNDFGWMGANRRSRLSNTKDYEERGPRPKIEGGMKWPLDYPNQIAAALFVHSVPLGGSASQIPQKESGGLFADPKTVCALRPFLNPFCNLPQASHLPPFLGGERNLKTIFLEDPKRPKWRNFCTLF